MFLFGPVVAIIGALLAAYTVYDLTRHWTSFWDDDIRPQDRQRAYRSVFLVLVPLAVLLHEVGHAGAVWQLGGRVVEFNWSFLSGYVVPDRRFDALGEWWVSFSGNLVSILLAPLALLVLFAPVGLMTKFLAVTFARLEWYYSLIGYPLLSLGGVQGDWVAIYGIPPWPLKVVIAVIHVGLIAAAVWLDRQPAVRRWEVQLDQRVREQVTHYEAEIRERPDEARPRLELAELYLNRGEVQLAQQTVQDALAVEPDHPGALTAAGMLAQQVENYSQAADYYERALSRLHSANYVAEVASRLGQVYTKMDRPDKAIVAYTQAIDHGAGAAETFYWRGRAYLRQHNQAAARADFQRAVTLDPEGEAGQQAAVELKDLMREE